MISVCMAHFNRPDDLKRAVENYRKVYPDLDIEFSICDDGSLLPPTTKGRVVLLPQKGYALNPCVPINHAVRNATRDIIVLTNPEVEHREPVLYRMLEALTGPNDYVATGCRDTRRGDWYAGPDAPVAPIGGRQPKPPGTHLHFCVMFHKALFERAGGFDEDYRHVPGCDDNDWLWRLWALGGVNFKYVPGVVWHIHGPRRRWPGTPEAAAQMLRRKWGHLEAFKQCES
jgi:hypothetical protein